MNNQTGKIDTCEQCYRSPISNQNCLRGKGAYTSTALTEKQQETESQTNMQVLPSTFGRQCRSSYISLQCQPNVVGAPTQLYEFPTPAASP